jgi:hypothetical protein
MKKVWLLSSTNFNVAFMFLKITQVEIDDVEIVILIISRFI